MKTKWWILIFSAAALLCLLALLLPRGSGTRVGVFFDGELLREIDLSSAQEPYEFTVSTEFGENRIRVEPDRVYIISSDCPDGTCLRHKALPGAATPIVCLPHRLVLRLLRGDSPVDAVAGVAG